MPARSDLVHDAAVAEDLLLARRGTAFFSRCLAGIDDADLAGPSRRPGWSRAHVVASVAYRARALAEALARLREGERPAVLAEPTPDTIAFGATLPPAALRNLHAHAAVHLSVEWRDLAPALWRTEVAGADGLVLVTATPRQRAREVWCGALDLEAGARADDLPDVLRPSR